MDAKYKVKYYIEDEIVEEEDFDDIVKAMDAAVNLDCERFREFEPEEYHNVDFEDDEEEEYEDPSFYAEAIRVADNVILIWANSEGDRGSDAEDLDFDVWDFCDYDDDGKAILKMKKE